MIDEHDQSKLLRTIHRSESSSFWLGVVIGFLAATVLFCAIIGMIPQP